MFGALKKGLDSLSTDLRKWSIHIKTSEAVPLNDVDEKRGWIYSERRSTSHYPLTWIAELLGDPDVKVREAAESFFASRSRYREHDIPILLTAANASENVWMHQNAAKLLRDFGIDVSSEGDSLLRPHYGQGEAREECLLRVPEDKDTLK